MGMSSQVTPVTAMWAHSWPVRAWSKTKSPAWANWMSTQGCRVWNQCWLLGQQAEDGGQQERQDEVGDDGAGRGAEEHAEHEADEQAQHHAEDVVQALGHASRPRPGWSL